MDKNKYKAIKIDGVKHDYHRWLMEQELGRKLDFNEIVHHVDENKLNNDIENLQVISRSEHARMHQSGRSVSTDTRSKLSNSNKGKPKLTMRKLTYEQAEYIRANYVPGDTEFGARALSRRFGISHNHILEIIKGERYVNEV